MRHQMAIPRLLAVVSLTASLAVAGCSAGSDTPRVASAGGDRPSASASASKPADRQDQLVRFAQCMRTNGVNVPDPAAGAQTVQLPADAKGDSRTQGALAKCQSLLGAGDKSGTDSAAQDRAVALAECLRGKGLDVADPQPGRPLQLSGAANTAKARQAITDCRSSTAAGAASPSSKG
nr:hypothetical protein OH826_34520 [Streptomyces sp. NBC_00899]